MATTCEATAQDHHDYVVNRSWLIFFGFAMIFALVWAIVGESHLKVPFAAAAFLLFLRAGVMTEASARKLDAGHH